MTRRHSPPRRRAESRLHAIFTGDCDDLVYRERDRNLFSEECGKCLPCRAHAAFLAAGLFKEIQRDLAEHAERRTIKRRSAHLLPSSQERRARADRRRA